MNSIETLEARVLYAAAPKGFAERWEHARLGNYVPLDDLDRVTTIKGDAGTWLLEDGEPSAASIIALNGGKALRIDSHIEITLTEAGNGRYNRGFARPIDTSTTISFDEQGEIKAEEAENSDSVELNLFIQGITGGSPDFVVLRYVFQHGPEYGQTQFQQETENFRPLLLDPAGGSYSRNILNDLSGLSALNGQTQGLRIVKIEFAVDRGNATFDNIVISGSSSSGGGGSVDGPVDLTASIGAITIPPAVVAGAVARGKVPIVVTNAGPGTVPKGQKIDVDIVARPNDGTPDVLLTTLHNQSVSKLKAGGTKKINGKVTLPTSFAQGAYQIVARIDSANALAESDETNNETASGGSVVVGPGPASVKVVDADLPSAIPLDDDADITDIVLNSGHSSLGEANVAYYLSANNSLGDDDHLLTSRDVSFLPPGTPSEGTTNLPLSRARTFVPVNLYILIVLRDGDDQRQLLRAVKFRRTE